MTNNELSDTMFYMFLINIGYTLILYIVHKWADHGRE